MKSKEKLASGYQILKFILFKKRKPIAARINLNNRCINKCKYCNVWNSPTKEMSTQQILSIIDELKEMGTQRISFSGGEPLLRNDIGKIITYCKNQEISPSMNSTGFMLDKRIESLQNIDLIKLSLDGKRRYNDALRGRGSFVITQQAAEIAFNKNIRFSFATTLTKLNTNIENIQFMLELSSKYNTFTAFQPLKKMYKGVDDLISLAPSKNQIKQVVNFLKEKKRDKSWKKHIRNSMMGLMHIENYPNYKKLKCNAGNIFIIIQPNGDVIPCDRITHKFKESIPNFVSEGMEESFKKLPQVKCGGCGFCGALELNYLTNLKFNTLSEILRIVK